MDQKRKNQISGRKKTETNIRTAQLGGCTEEHKGGCCLGGVCLGGGGVGWGGGGGGGCGVTFQTKDGAPEEKCMIGKKSAIE